MYNPKELNQIIDRLNILSMQNKDNNTGEVYSQLTHLAQTIIIELDKLYNEITALKEQEPDPPTTSHRYNHDGPEY